MITKVKQKCTNAECKEIIECSKFRSNAICFYCKMKRIRGYHKKTSKSINCPLCKESKEWPFPKERDNHFGYHFWLGKHWMPTKGHPQYELHNKLKYHKKKLKNH